MRERADVKPQYLFPGNAPGKALQGIKKFWRDITEQAGLEDYLPPNRRTHVCLIQPTFAVGERHVKAEPAFIDHPRSNREAPGAAGMHGIRLGNFPA